MTPPEFLYYLGYSIKKRYVTGNRQRLPNKVVSIGNITYGGTGKTPAAIALANEAKRRGFHPCVLTRGYRGKAKGPCFVSMGEGPLLDEYRAGDEALLLAEKLKGIPVVKGKNRYEAGMFALRSLLPALRPDLFILDDGFQHWSLHRDKDILLIDSLSPFGNRRLLPLGPLREPLGALDRADIIVITKTDKAGRRIDKGNGLIEEIKKYNARAPIFLTAHRPSAFITMKGDVFSIEWSRNKNFFAFCGIGNPRSFSDTLSAAGVKITGLRHFRDHYRYSAGDIKAITGEAKTKGAEWIVTTEKDIMRLRGLAMPHNIVALAIEFTADEEFYNEAFNS